MGWGGDGPQDFVTNCMWQVRERKKRKLIEWVCNNLILCVFWFQILLFCSNGLPYDMPHQPNIHLPLWHSHYRFFWVSILICVGTVGLLTQSSSPLTAESLDSVPWGL